MKTAPAIERGDAASLKVICSAVKGTGAASHNGENVHGTYTGGAIYAGEKNEF